MLLGPIDLPAQRPPGVTLFVDSIAFRTLAVPRTTSKTWCGLERERSRVEETSRGDFNSRGLINKIAERRERLSRLGFAKPRSIRRSGCGVRSRGPKSNVFRDLDLGSSKPSQVARRPASPQAVRHRGCPTPSRTCRYNIPIFGILQPSP